jgi:dihydroflavonol-4-reductase
MKALVTGSTGFVGANLVEGLVAARHQVRALHRSSSRLDALAGLSYEPAIGDVLDLASLEDVMGGVDWVFHVAAVADYWRQGGTTQLYQVNVEGTRHVLAAALASGVRRVVFTSSAAALGMPPEQTGASLDESATFDLPPSRFPYGHSKHLAEEVVREFVARGLDAVIVNPTVILGPKDLNFISGSIIREVYRRRVRAVPPGCINYVDVSDVVAGQIAAAERGRMGERYLLGGHNLTHREALQVIAQVVGVPPPRLRLPLALIGPLALLVDLFNRVWPGEALADGNQVRLMKHTFLFDSSKARRELALGSPVPFQTSVERTFQWYKENGYL